MQGLPVHTLASGDPPSQRLCPSLLVPSFLASVEPDSSIHGFLYSWRNVGGGMEEGDPVIPLAPRPQQKLGSFSDPELEGLMTSMGS